MADERLVLLRDKRFERSQKQIEKNWNEKNLNEKKWELEITLFERTCGLYAY